MTGVTASVLMTVRIHATHRSWPPAQRSLGAFPAASLLVTDALDAAAGNFLFQGDSR